MRARKYIESKKPLVYSVAVVCLMVGIFGIYRVANQAKTQNATSKKTLSVSGRLEGTETKISATVPGRVAKVPVQEGDSVNRNQVLVQLDDSDLAPKLQEAEVALEAARAQQALAEQWLKIATESGGTSANQAILATAPPSKPVKAAVRSNGVYDKNVEHAVTINGTKGDTAKTVNNGTATNAPGNEQTGASAASRAEREIDDNTNSVVKQIEETRRARLSSLDEATRAKLTAEEEILQARLAALEATFPDDTRFGARLEVFNAKKQALQETYLKMRQAIQQAAAVEAKSIDEWAQAKSQAAMATLQAQKEALSKIKSAEQNMIARLSQLRAAQVRQMGTANSGTSVNALRAAQSAQRKGQLLEAQTRVVNATNQVLQAQAARNEVVAKRSAYAIVCPANGICVSRRVEPGEVVMPGQQIMSVISGDRVFMRAMVPSSAIDQLRSGQRARVFIKGQPRPLTAMVVSVDPKQVAGIGAETQNAGGVSGAQSKYYGVRLRLSNVAPSSLKPGTSAMAEIDLAGAG